MNEKNVPAKLDDKQLEAAARFGLDPASTKQEDIVLLAVLAANPYELATGALALSPAAVLAIEKLDSRRLVRWLSLCKTPEAVIKARPGPGASCPPEKPKCRKCPKYDDCGHCLDYVDAGFVEQVLTFFWPGRWGTRDVKVFQLDGQWHAEGYFWVEHSDGRKQELFVSGQCDAKKKRDGSPLSTGFDRKGALSDMIKKGAAMMLGVAFDIYNQRDPSIPEVTAAGEDKQTLEKMRTSFKALLGQVDDIFGLLHKETPSYAPENYPPEALWNDAVRLFLKLEGCQPDFTVPKSVLDTLLDKLNRAEALQLYGKLKAKYLNGTSEWRTKQKEFVEGKSKMPWVDGMSKVKDEYLNEFETCLAKLQHAFPSVSSEARENMLQQQARFAKYEGWWVCNPNQLERLVSELVRAAEKRN